MISHSNRTNQTLRRHDLIFVSPLACRALLETRDDVVEERLVMNWADRGWPLVARSRHARRHRRSRAGFAAAAICRQTPAPEEPVPPAYG